MNTKTLVTGIHSSREDCILSAFIIILPVKCGVKKKKKKKNDTDRPFVCPSCPKVFPSLDEHAVHIDCHIKSYQQKGYIKRE
jgi:hypothetical protein